MEEEIKVEENKKEIVIAEIIPVIIFAVFVLIIAVIIGLRGKNNISQLPSASPLPSQESNLVKPSGEEVQDSLMQEIDKLLVEDLVIGKGVEATSGAVVSVNYVGTLTDGQKFDSSYDRNTPFSFTLGAGQVIEGWDQGVLGMKVGGKRKLTIPSSLAYGESGIPNAIPGGATLIFEVELLDVK